MTRLRRRGLLRDPRLVDPSAFDEAAFYRAIAASGARVLLIGRRAMAALGAPMGTSPAAARAVGRYILENDERVDVLVTSQVTSVDGDVTRFDDLLSRAHRFELAPGAPIPVPTVGDLITTKRFAARPKDLEDIRLLEALRRELGE